MEELLSVHNDTMKKDIKEPFLSLLFQPSEKNKFSFERTVDQTEIESLLKKVKKNDSPARYVSLLFLDALFHSCFHAANKNYLSIINRDVLVINSYYGEPFANLSHSYPQIILGLKKRWSQSDLLIFRQTFFEYLEFYKDQLDPNVIEILKHDKDLDSENLVYQSVGIKIGKNVMSEFQNIRNELRK